MQVLALFCLEIRVSDSGLSPNVLISLIGQGLVTGLAVGFIEDLLSQCYVTPLKWGWVHSISLGRSAGRATLKYRSSRRQL